MILTKSMSFRSFNEHLINLENVRYARLPASSLKSCVRKVVTNMPILCQIWHF